MIVNRLPLMNAGGNVFGVMWDYSQSSTALTRLTKATDPNGYVNVTISTEPSPAVGTGDGSSPFDSYAPWKDMDEYNIINNAVSYRKGDAEFSRSSYDTMVYIPEFYVKYIDDTANSKMYFYVSDGKKSGFVKHPGSNCYIGRYHTAYSSGYVSKTNLSARTQMVRATARTDSHSKGSKWYQWSIAQWQAVQILYLVEFADFNSQSKIGIGRTNGSSINSGGTDNMIYHTGRDSGTNANQKAVQYRHIENLWGSCYNMIDGINLNDRKAYVCLDPSKWADDTDTGYTDTGLTLPSGGYITGLGVSSSEPWLILPTAASGGSATTYVSDYVYMGTGWRIAAVAGNYSGTSEYCGMFRLYGGNLSTSKDQYTSSRLLFSP